MSTITSFIKHHYRHFNAAALIDAAEAYKTHLASGGKMFMTIAGAMSTAELGLSLAEMIRQDKVHGICCTGANLEEDVFNLVAHDFYERVPHYRDLTPADEAALLARHMNRVTDTCIPEMEAMRRIENEVLQEWVRADQAHERYFPHQFMYKILLSGVLKGSYQIDPKNSWLLAAAEKNLPMFVPGWEDATLGNMYAGHCVSGDVKNVHTVRTGIEYMMELAEWYTETTKDTGLGFFQIGGGIAGDAAPGLATGARTALGLLLPDLGLHHQLWLLLRCRTEREDHVGQTWREDAEIHRGVGRFHRSATDVRLRSRLVDSPHHSRENRKEAARVSEMTEARAATHRSQPRPLALSDVKRCSPGPGLRRLK
jgi:deoxyhypusine synthase